MINMYRPLSSVGPEDPREDYVGDKNLYLGGDALHQQRLDELYSNGCKNTERSVGRYARAVCCCKGGPVFPVRLFIHDVGMTETWTQVSTKKTFARMTIYYKNFPLRGPAVAELMLLSARPGVSPVPSLVLKLSISDM